MKANTQVKCDVRGIMARIEQVGERAVKGISDAMRYYAEVMIRDALANAPRDTGSLERALDVEYMRNGVNGRLWVKIRIDPSEPYIDPNPNHKPSSKTVGDYAYLMERYLQPHGSGSRWFARKGTTDKGPQAGGRFLERAVKNHKAALLQRAKEIAKRAAQS